MGAHPIHHSWIRGASIAATSMSRHWKVRGLPISMTEVDHCAENALAERMNGILKQEYRLGMEFATRLLRLRLAVEQGIWLYNNKRPHMALNYRMPEAVHQPVLN